MLHAQKQFTYRQQDATLIIGYDNMGRLYSNLKKNGKTYAIDIYQKMPSEVILLKQGWKRVYE